MRSLLPLSFVLVIPVVAACAGGGGDSGGYPGYTGHTTSGHGGSTGSGQGGAPAGAGSGGGQGGGSTSTSTSGSISTSSTSTSTSSSTSTTSTSTSTSTSSSTSTTSTSTSSSSTSTSSSGGGAPTTCAQADGGIGCCTSAGVLYYCTTTMTVHKQTCAAGTVCGWNAAQGYYDCVPPPGGADPTNTHPLLCGGGTSSSSSSSTSTSTSSSSTSTSSSTSASSSTSSSGGTVTWTTIYNTIFGPSGTSPCAKNGSCHTGNQSGFTCGTSKTTCYNGLVNAGYVTPGAGASSSALLDPSLTPLCGGSNLTGNMPLNYPCITAAQEAEIQTWLNAGAPDN